MSLPPRLKEKNSTGPKQKERTNQKFFSHRRHLSYDGHNNIYEEINDTKKKPENLKKLPAISFRSCRNSYAENLNKNQDGLPEKIGELMKSLRFDSLNLKFDYMRINDQRDFTRFEKLDKKSKENSKINLQDK